MRLKTILLFILVIQTIFVATAFAAEPPVVSNVKAQQREGSNLVDITFDLHDGDGDLLLIRLKLSADGTPVIPINYSGDVGFNIEPDTNKHIVWNVGIDYPDSYSDHFIATIEAADAIFDASGNSEPFTVDTRIDKPPIEGWQILSNTGHTYNENMLIDSRGKVWCFYLRSYGKRQPIYMKVLNPDGNVYRSEKIIGYGSSLVEDEYQTIRAALNRATGDIWVVIQGNSNEKPIGYFLVFDESAEVKQDSTQIITLGKVNAPKVASDSSGTMWFCWHTDTSGTDGSKGAFIRYNSNGEKIDSDSLHFTDDRNLINTDLACDSNNRIWFIGEKTNESFYQIYNNDGTFFKGEKYSSDQIQFDPRKSVYADLTNGRVWIFKRNNNVDLNQLIGRKSNGDLFCNPISEIRPCSFINNQNNRLEIVQFNHSNSFYQFSEYNSGTGAKIRNWTNLWEELATDGGVTEYVAYNPQYPNLKTYLVRTDEHTTKVKFSNVEPISVKIEVSRDTLYFGNVGIDIQRTDTLIIKNSGNTTLNVIDISSTNDKFIVDEPDFSLEPGDVKNVVITFKPQDAIDYEGKLVIQSNADNGTQVVVLKGTGYERTWSIDVDPDSIIFGQVPISYVKKDTFIVKNAGTEILTISDIQISDSTFKIKETNTQFYLYPQDSKFIEILFIPIDTLLRTAQLAVISDAQDNSLAVNNIQNFNNTNSDTQKIYLEGQGFNYIAPRILVEPDVIDFDSLKLGSSKVKSFHVKNIGNDTLKVKNVTVDDNQFSIGSSDSTFEVAPDSSYEVHIQYTATTVNQTRATIYIYSNDPENATVKITAMGRGFTYGDPDIFVNPTSLVFDTVSIGKTSRQTLFISNEGTDVLQIFSISTTNAQFAASYDTNTYGVTPTIAPGDPIMWLEVSFTPQNSGIIEGSMVINNNDPDNPQKQIQMSGIGRNPNPPKLSVNPDSLYFGSVKVTQYAKREILLKNEGELDLTISNITIDDSHFLLQSNTSHILSQNESTILKVTFYPDTSKVISGNLIIFSNNPENPEFYVPLVGIGIPLPPQKIHISPKNINFGEIVQNSYSTKYLWLSNQGGKTLSISNIESTSKYFEIGFKPLVLSPYQNKYVPITFRTDTTTGEFSSILSIYSDDPDSNISHVLLEGTCRKPLPPQISTNYVEGIDFGEVRLNSTNTKRLKIYNSGEANLIVTDILPSDSQFTIYPNKLAIPRGSYQFVYIYFTPNKLGQFNEQISIKSNAANDTNLVLQMRGSVRPLRPAKIFLKTNYYDFGNIAYTKTASYFLAIKNSGEDTLSLTLNHNDTTHFQISTKAIKLYGGQTKNLLVIFSPDTIKSYSSTLKIKRKYDPEDSTKYVVFYGTGRAPSEQKIAVSSDSLKFGTVAKGKEKILSVRIYNRGETDLQISNVLFSIEEYSILEPVNGLKLSENDWHRIDIRFRPIQAATYNASMTIQTNDRENPNYTITLTGNGREEAPIIAFDPDSIYFGSVLKGNSSERSLYVKNIGEEDLEVTAIVRSDRENFWINNDNFTIRPGGSELVIVTFKPVTAKTFTDTLTFKTDDNYNNNSKVKLFAVGRDSSDQKIVIIPDRLDFGSVVLGNEKIDTLNIYNQGDRLLEINKLKSNNSAFQVDSTGFTLTSSAVKKIPVKFMADTIKTYEGQISVDNNDENVEIELSGSGRELKSQELWTNIDSLFFGSVEIDSIVRRSFFIYNNGDLPLKLINISTSNQLFSVNYDTSQINGQGKRLITVNFKPVNIGQQEGLLLIQSDAPLNNTISISLSGIGIEKQNMPRIYTSPDFIDFAEVEKNDIVARKLWIGNIGNDTLKISEIISDNSLFYADKSSLILIPTQYKQLTVFFNATTVDSVTTFKSILSIYSNDPTKKCVKIQLQAKIKRFFQPKISIYPKSLNFGSVVINKTKEQQLLVENRGEQTLEIFNVTSSDSQFFVAQNRYSILPNSRTYLKTYFKPVSKDTFTAKLTIISNDTTNDSLTVVDLLGVGREIRPQAISLSVDTVDFGVLRVNQTKLFSFYIHNSGEKKLEITKIELPDAEQFRVLTKWFAENLLIISPSESEKVTIAYQPIHPDTFNSKIIIRSNDPDRKIVDLPLAAKCVDYKGPYITYEPGSLDFGDMIWGGSKTLSILIKNNSKDSSLIINKIFISDSAFTQIFEIDQDSLIIAPDRKVSIYVTFQPDKPGVFNTTLKFLHNDVFGDSDFSIHGTCFRDSSGVNELNYLSGWHSNGFFPFKNVLGAGRDNVYLVKDFYVYNRPIQAELFIAFNDTVDVYLNGSHVLNSSSDTLKYWNIDKYDVTPYILLGRNRIACYVATAIDSGDFDCVLLLDNLPIIRKGSYYNVYPEATSWWYYGMKGIYNKKPALHSGRSWTSNDYGWSNIDTVVTSWNFEYSTGNILTDGSRYNRRYFLGDIRSVKGIIGNAVEFYGQNDSRIKIEANIDGVPSTISLWVKPFENTGHKQIIINNGYSGYYGHGLFLDENMRLGIFYQNGQFMTDEIIKINQWYFLAVQYFQDSIRVFINNTKDTTFSYIRQIPRSRGYTFIGANHELIAEDSGFKGIIDELTILNSAQNKPKINNVISIFKDDSSLARKAHAMNLEFNLHPFPIDIQDGKLMYAPGGKHDYQTITINSTSLSDSIFTVEIPPEHVTIRGLKYKLFLNTNYGAINYPTKTDEDTTFWVTVYTNQEESQVQVDTSYRMISVPYNLAHNSVKSILEDDFGTYSQYDWRLFQWNQTDSNYIEYNNPKWSDQPGFARGHAVWAVSREKLFFDSDSGWSAENMNQYKIELQPGWNQIANPFPFSVAWDSVICSNEKPHIYYWNPDSFDYKVMEDQFLDPWEGYFVFNPEIFPFSLLIPPTEADISTLQKKICLTDYYQEKYKDLKILILAKAYCGNYKDSQNIMGAFEGARYEWDHFDVLEAPKIGNFISLSINNSHWKAHNGNYAIDFQNVNDEGYVWQLDAVTNLKQEKAVCHLTINNIIPYPDNWKAFLFDLNQDIGINLLDQNNYSYKISNNESNEKRLKLVIGTEEFIQNNNDDIPMMPLRFCLFNNYPNPFNPSTTISFNLSQRSYVEIYIYNVLGQKVRILTEKQLRAGHHNIQWNGSNDQGNIVTSGLYFILLKAEGKTAIKKIMFIK